MVVREYAELWAQYFKYLTDSLHKIEITEDMEKDFEQLLTVLSINHYKFSQLVGDYMKDPGAVLEMLAETVNIQTIKECQEATLSKWQVEVHTLLISMHKALGKMHKQLTPKELEAMQMAQQEEEEPTGREN